MILNYVRKYITKLFDTILFYAMCVKTGFTIKHSVSNLHINVLLLGQHVEKIIVIMGVINGQIFIIISNIS